MQELINTARAEGAKKVLGMVPAVWSRWIRKLGMHAEPAGRIMDIDGSKVQVALMDLSENKSLTLPH